MEESDWLAACRRIAAGVADELARRPTTRERAVAVGRGEGGDETLAIDAAAEAVIFGELERMHAAGARFQAVSEERGEVDFGGGAGDPRVVIDPLDGSLNAKRGLAPYTISIAVADGPTMADVRFAYVYDLVHAEEWTARSGGGAFRDGVAIDVAGAERRNSRGQLEIVAVELVRPRRLGVAAAQLAAGVHRMRTFGSIAYSLCQLAGARIDGVVTLWGTRSVDAAAGQLIVREAGGLVAFAGAVAGPLEMQLDLVARAQLVAALTPAGLEALAAIPAEDGALRSSQR
ncbi:MAG TPA: inositol monophosphatase family protein [Solirubrobacteraceae bacterium]|nr:inositol monophosphatase family protein [Solirubrobacteraceae bacterium]